MDARLVLLADCKTVALVETNRPLVLAVGIQGQLLGATLDKGQQLAANSLLAVLPSDEQACEIVTGEANKASNRAIREQVTVNRCRLNCGPDCW